MILSTAVHSLLRYAGLTGNFIASAARTLEGRAWKQHWEVGNHVLHRQALGSSVRRDFRFHFL